MEWQRMRVTIADDKGEVFEDKFVYVKMDAPFFAALEILDHIEDKWDIETVVEDE